jgi:hypothetical protein
MLPATPPTPSPRTNSNPTPSKDTTPRVSNVAGPSTKPQPPTPARSQPPGLGPVITPSRQALSKPGPPNSRGAGPRRVPCFCFNRFHRF